MKITIMFWLLFFFSLNYAQQVKWKNLNDAVAENGNKYILVNVYADWCGYCRKMDSITYKDQNVQKMIRDYFTAAKVNCNSKDSIKINDESLSPEELLDHWKVEGYPATVILDPKGNYICKLAGYRESVEFSNVLNYIGSDAYRNKSFKQFINKEEGSGASVGKSEGDSSTEMKQYPENNQDEFAAIEKVLTDEVIDPENYELTLQASLADENSVMIKELSNGDIIRVKNRSVYLNGSVKSASMLTGITLKEHNLRTGEDSDKWVFSKRISLDKGENILQLKVTDAFKKTRSINFTIVYNR